MDTDAIVVLVMFGAYLGLLFTGFPVAFVLAGTAVLTAFMGEYLRDFHGIRIGVDINYLGLVVNRIWGIMSNTELVAIPLFILMGYVMELGGVSHQLMRALQTLMRRVPGGLALCVVIIGIVLAASTGVIGAALILLGTLAIKPMLDDKYRPEMALGVVAASGCLGILIPPSIMLIIMSDQLQLPVGDLFMAAVFPGLMLGAFYAAYVIGHAFLRPAHRMPGETEGSVERLRSADFLRALRAMIPPILLIVAVLGSIFMGIATPTEAAGVGAAGALTLAAANGRLKWSRFVEMGMATVRTNAFVFAVMIGATCFAVVLRGVGGDHVIREAALGMELVGFEMVLLILSVVFILGFFLDWIEISLIVVPIARPILDALNVDRLWFAILLAVCLQTSFLTPPMGPALFYVKALAPKGIGLMRVYRGVVPFVILQLIGLTLVLLIPGLATWLPRAVY